MPQPCRRTLAAAILASARCTLAALRHPWLRWPASPALTAGAPLPGLAGAEGRRQQAGISYSNRSARRSGRAGCSSAHHRTPTGLPPLQRTREAPPPSPSHRPVTRGCGSMRGQRREGRPLSVEPERRTAGLPRADDRCACLSGGFMAQGMRGHHPCTNKTASAWPALAVVGSGAMLA